MNITEVFNKLNLPDDVFIPYGRGMAKLDTEKWAIDKKKIVEKKPQQQKSGHLILVTAMNPTPKGEGKTTTTIGLGDGLSHIGKHAVICLRQPSMGPCFGVKGGATGGGKSMLTPMDQINLNFTGDFHAIASAHNLLSAMIDNHLHFGNELKIDARRVTWRRVIDMNDRALRSIVQSLGGVGNGFPREDGFDITVASEVMAIFCLSNNLQDLQERLGKIIIGTSLDKKPVTAKDLNAHGAMTAILKSAILPNLVQTLEGTPAIVHGGPFANIAHGCNSVIATRAGLEIADYVVTEAGFGADLGAEKFLNIKCRSAGIWPSCVVLVATVRAIAYQADSLEAGMVNIRRHVENLKKFSLQVVVAINRFTDDTENDLNFVKEYCQNKLQTKCIVNESWAKGGAGAQALANEVVEMCSGPSNTPTFLYSSDMPLIDKIRTIAQKLYGAQDIDADAGVFEKLKRFESMGFGNFPVCMAKTQYSFSTDPTALGAATGHVVKIREVRLSAGAGFVVVICGEIMTMPGLPKKPTAESVFVDSEGNIQGLF